MTQSTRMEKFDRKKDQEDQEKENFQILKKNWNF